MVSPTYVTSPTHIHTPTFPPSFPYSSHVFLNCHSPAVVYSHTYICLTKSCLWEESGVLLLTKRAVSSVIGLGYVLLLHSRPGSVNVVLRSIHQKQRTKLHDVQNEEQSSGIGYQNRYHGCNALSTRGIDSR